MTAQEEREQIKAKIIEDINFLQTKEIDIRTSLRSYFSDIQEFAPIDKALNTVKMNTTKYLDTGTINTLHTFYTNYINRFTIAARAFINNSSSKNTQKELIESAKNFNEFIDQLDMSNTTKNTGVKIGGSGIVVGGVDVGQEIQNIKENIKKLQSSETLIEITSKLTQIDSLFEKALSSEQLINDEIQELKKAKEGQIAYKLSEELQKKADSLKKEADKKLGEISIYNIIAILFSLTVSLIIGSKYAQYIEAHTLLEIIASVSAGSILTFLLIAALLDFRPSLKKDKKESLSPLKISGFYGAITLMLLINIITWIIYLIAPDISTLITHKSYARIEFWHFMMLKLTINIFLFVYVGFALNEYTKAKKLYEEFDYKRIMAQTLMNNFNLFRIELLGNDTSVSSNQRLLDLIQTPLEKIFDNPVHSIYGDKSGDKNIGLDQLEKITSIIEKMKKNNQ